MIGRVSNTHMHTIVTVIFHVILGTYPVALCTPLVIFIQCILRGEAETLHTHGLFRAYTAHLMLTAILMGFEVEFL